jgi:hypothetical protein
MYGGNMGIFERHRYPANWEELAFACKERAQWQCQRPECGAKHGDIRVGAVSGKEYTVVIAACHVNHDPENPEAVLKSLCQACHMRLDGFQHSKTRMRKRWQMITIQQRGAGQLEMVLEAKGKPLDLIV